ncbi:hypothetical protein FB645_002747 [Coemansia sp. IMI 203386]|nr:hypothetical protein FB645_002747 [Coemansia sp. IMI 203386]
MGKHYKKRFVPWKKNRTKPTSQEEPPAAPDIQIAGLTRNSSGNQHISNNGRSREPDVATGISIAGKHKGGESQKRQEQQHQLQQKSFAGKKNIKEGSGVEIAGISHVGSTSRHKQREEENNENGITIGGKAAMKHRQQEQHGFHPYQKQHGYKYKRYRKETATERLSDDMADETTRAKSKREIKRQEAMAKKKEYLEKRKNRSLFGYHMSQVVHQDNMDRVAAETAAKLASGGFNVALPSQQQQKQQQPIQLQQQQDQQGISNSDLATFLRGLGDYMTATANTIVKATSVSAATNTGGGRTESDIHALSTLSQNSSFSASASVIQNSAGEVATASVNDRASTRRKPTASNHMNNTAMISEQRSEMDIDASRSSHSNTKHYSSSKSKEVLDFDLDVSDIE